MDRPLPALLSQALVAFTMEFDNESEHQLQHRTTSGPAAAELITEQRHGLSQVIQMKVSRVQ